MKRFVIVHLYLLFLTITTHCYNQKRALQKSHEKPRLEKWVDKILKNDFFREKSTLTSLIAAVINNHLNGCVAIILYDGHIQSEWSFLDKILEKIEISIIHGQIAKDFTLEERSLMDPQLKNCVNYVMLLEDVMSANEVIKFKTSNKIVLITKSSQSKVIEFLYSESSRRFVNLLIILPSLENKTFETYVLYTHKLYVDGLGSSEPIVLTSWRNGALTRPKTDLFPPKFKGGFSGNRFLTSLGLEPPFVINNGYDENDNIIWDGSEIRLLKLLSELYNFTTDFKQAVVDLSNSTADVVIDNIKKNKAVVGLSGIYVTSERLETLDITYPHTQDCAAFVSLTSTALPRYRAIMGPFHWSVWLALASAYLLIIFPLAFADKHTLMHLLRKPEEIENMFWYVFGTFTNCFTFGKDNWTKSERTTPRMIMGFYWIFTTIITACYTGSIIAFITLPMYPLTVDTVEQLLAARFRTGTLNKGGWEYWFQNSADPHTARLLKNMEYVPDVESGLRNTTKAFFWPYAFLGSQAQLDYIVRTKFIKAGKRQLFHISSECFVPFGVSVVFEKNSEYKEVINEGISRIVQSGFMIKFKRDIEWNTMRTSTGKLLQAGSGRSLRNIAVEDRTLTLDDTQGIFLLLGAGFLVGAAALVSEMLGGCLNCFKRSTLSVINRKRNRRIYDRLSPSEKINTTPLKQPKSTENLVHIGDTDFFEEKFVNNYEFNEEIYSSPNND